jgi:hypothetical protein
VNKHLISAALLALSISVGAVDLATTPLGIAAAALQVGQAAKFETPTYQSIPMDFDQFYYSDGAPWNPVAQRIQFVASGLQGDPRHFYLYDVATDTWSVDDTGSWVGIGHGFDSNAIDTVSGVHYFAKYGGPVLQRSANGTWDALPPAPFTIGTTPALEYLPGAGLVLASRSGNIAVWNGVTWTQITGAVSWGITENWATTVGEVTYIGTTTFVYRLKRDAAQPNGYLLERMPDPPLPIGNSKALHVSDGGNLLVAMKNGTAWYEFDGVAWKPRPELVSGAVVNKWHYHIAYVPDLSVIVTMSMRGGVRDVWIVKVGDPPPPPPPATCVPNEVIPFEYRGLPLCSAEAVKRDVCDQPGVFACDRFDGAPLTGSIVRASSKLTTPWVADGVLNMAVVSMGGKDTGHYRVRMPSISEGGLLAFTYRKRLDAEAMKHNGSKDFIVWGPHWAPSCTTQQVVMTHMYSAQVPIAYRSCGLGISSRLPDGDHVWHNSDFDCRYRDAKAGRVAKCHTKTANQWATYYTEIRVGHYGQPDSTITMHVKTADGWRKMMDFPFMLPSNVPLEQIMLTGYMTNETIYEHPGGRIAFDDFIASTQPLDMALL